MIVGTAGHVDHGKTALVQRLTGVDTDRLAEEKARGITIELGFAYLPLPDGAVLGFVDVPGHERFVATMLAGAAGIDIGLLVVAADDGVMPQTREHLQILDLLGIERGVVAITKADLAGEQRRLEVEEEVRAALAGTALATAPILPVSARTGEGIEALRQRLAAEAGSPSRRPSERAFRFSVDRSFVLQGAGTVVTGVPFDGRVEVGQTLLALPSGLTARVRSLHAQSSAASSGAVGQRIALNLAGQGVTRDAVQRGHWLVDPAWSRQSCRLDAELRLLPGEPRPLRQWLPARFHHGASHVAARVVVLEAETLEPGRSGLVQIVLGEPLPLRHGDRFVLRDTSAQRTIAGGRVIDPRAPERRRRTPERLAMLAALRHDDPDDALAALAALPPGFVDLGPFAQDRGLATAQLAPILAGRQLLTLAAGEVRYATTAGAWSRLRREIEAVLAAFHEQQPDLPGMAAERLRLATATRLGKPAHGAAIRQLAALGVVVVRAPWVRLAAHHPRPSPEDQRRWAQLRPMLGRERFKPPRVRDMAQALAQPEPAVRRTCKALARMGELAELAPDHFFLRGTVSEMAGIAAQLSIHSATGEFAAAAFRDRLDNGRKVAIQVLEYFDRHGLTSRRGDLRRVVKDPVQLFGEPAE